MDLLLHLRKLPTHFELPRICVRLILHEQIDDAWIVHHASLQCIKAISMSPNVLLMGVEMMPMHSHCAVKLLHVCLLLFEHALSVAAENGKLLDYFATPSRRSTGPWL